MGVCHQICVYQPCLRKNLGLEQFNESYPILPKYSPETFVNKLWCCFELNLENALKYSQPDTKVELELSLLPNQIKFPVQDKGIGIPTENLSHIFNSFYRANNVETKPGMGLGLSIVKRCVDIHRGGIAVNSSVGKGTIFTVTLPRQTLSHKNI